MSKRPPDLLLQDIWDAIAKVERYTAGLTQQAFFEDDKSTDAVVRNLEVIGEAANRLPQEFKAEHSEVEWSKIVGLRHRIVHDYFGIDLEIIWQILQHDLPVFKSDLARIRSQS